MIKTKIIATIGPACHKEETIKTMIDHGVDIFRLNFSHGTFQEHAEFLKTINAARSRHQHTTAVMGDLCGPKIRTGKIQPEGQILQPGDEITIVPGEQLGTPKHFGTNYQFFTKDAEIGHRIFIDDGQISLRVINQHDDQTICQVVVGGPLFSHKGINLPDSQVSMPSITEQDWLWVDWAIEHGLDFLALSFVRSDTEIKQLKTYLEKAGADINLVAKIEKPQAIEHLESIVQASDAILVARGDLGVEMDLAEVPIIQKHITRICRHLGKPVIVATQMLQSMIEIPTATRAEVSDVANAIMDSTDAVMLSGETAVGKYPLDAAQTIQRIARVTEAYLEQHKHPPARTATSPDLQQTAAIAYSVDQLVDDIDARLVAVWSQTGTTARLLSKQRINAPILAFSSDKRNCQQMSLHYGVISRCHPVPQSLDEFIRLVEDLIISRNWVQAGEKIVIVLGQSFGAAGTTNAIMVHTVPPDKKGNNASGNTIS